MHLLLSTLLIVFAVVFFMFRDELIRDTSISLKWVHQAQFAGMYIAKENGLYKKAGLNVHIKEFDFVTQPVDDLLTGRCDFALMSAEEFLTHVDQGKDFVAVAAFYQQSPYAFATLKNSGIENPADFVGKKLGTKAGKVEQRLAYELLLTEYGIPKNKVEIIEVGFGTKEIEDLVQGTVDVIDLYRTDQSYFFEKDAVAYNLIRPERFGVTVFNDVLVVRRDTLDEYPDMVKAFIEATLDGWHYALDNKQEAIDVTMEYITDPNYKDVEYQRYILENSEPLIKPSTSSLVGSINTLQMQKLYQNMKERGFLDGYFDVTRFYDSSFVHR